MIRARRGRDAANVGVWRAQSGHPAHGALLSCIFSLVPCINRRGRPFPSQRTPAWTVQKPEFSASRPPPAAPRTGNAARSASFWGHGTARNARYRRAGPRLPTQIARRGISRDQIDASDAYAATPACCKLPKMHGAPRGPVRAVKKHARIQNNASVKVRWQQGRQAASGIPSVSARALRPPCVSRELHVLRLCQNPAYANLQLSR